MRVSIKLIIAAYLSTTVFISGVCLAVEKAEIKNETDRINGQGILQQISPVDLSGRGIGPVPDRR